MIQLIAILIFACGITGLFLLDRNRKIRTSPALLIPLLWLLIAGSRNAGEWLQGGTVAASDASDAYLDGNPFDRNFLTVMITMAAVVLIRRQARVLAFVRANRVILLYFAYCGFSLLWSDYPFVGFKRWIRTLGDVMMVLIVLTDRHWLTARNRVYAWAGFLLLPTSILLIRYYSELGRRYNVHDGSMNITGVATSKNELGMVCMIFGLAAASRFLEAYGEPKGKRRNRTLLAHGAVVAIALYLIYSANSATALACTMLGLATLLLTSWPRFVRRKALVHTAVAAMLLVSFSALFLNLGSGLVEGLGRDSTLTGRTDVWEHVVTLVKNPWFGTGFESFWLGPRLVQMRSIDPNLNQAHNGYLEVYLNLGWAGIALLGAVIITGYRNIMSSLKEDPGPARLRLGYFVVTLAYNFTEGAFKMRSPVWISFLMVIIVVPKLVSRQVRVRAESTSIPAELTPGQPRFTEESI